MVNIWCMFSVENNYDQPPNNLVVCWVDKPCFEAIMSAIGGNMSRDEDIIAAAEVMKGGEARVNETDYRLEQVRFGVMVGEKE